MDELTIGDKTYISSKQAAKITGYAKDYVGQLCREGRVNARLVGRNWFVLESSIREHRFGAVPTHAATSIPEEMPIESPMRTAMHAWEPPSYTSVPQDAVIPTLPTLKKASQSPDTAEAVALMQDAWTEWFATRQKALPDGEEMLHTTDLPMIMPEVEEEEEEMLVEAPAPVRNTDISSMYATDKVSRVEGDSFSIPVTRLEEEREIEEIEKEYIPAPVSYVRTPTATAFHPRPHTAGTVIDLSRPNREAPEAPVRMRHAPASQPARRTPLALQAILLSIAGLIAVGAVVGSGLIDDELAARGLDSSLRGIIFDTLRGESRLEK